MSPPYPLSPTTPIFFWKDRNAPWKLWIDTHFKCVLRLYGNWPLCFCQFTADLLYCRFTFSSTSLFVSFICIFFPCQFTSSYHFHTFSVNLSSINLVLVSTSFITLMYQVFFENHTETIILSSGFIVFLVVGSCLFHSHFVFLMLMLVYNSVGSVC